MKQIIAAIVILCGLSAYCAGEASLGSSNAEFAFKLYGKHSVHGQDAESISAFAENRTGSRQRT
ncbi:MAG TPA: hypothetical protein DCZ94_17855 [Lentisphaeria bacterium]|nr:MAG: hypothetical protein A2X48_03595 [Lentisphaerae bacterium GWF2_49_21]HBC88811.1 hypothetical protein [Lentisphaeria bacterium]